MLLLVQLSLQSLAREKVEEQMRSAYLNGTVRYTVWLPDHRIPEQKCTTIYTFSYGASDAEFTSAEMRYLNKLHITHLPPVIVVKIWADMDRIGYNYETGLLTPPGMKMVECLRKELIPAVEGKYQASAFRTYMGQSYGASYGNYLFLYQPDIFSGYILMSPEKLAPSQPPFEITPELGRFYARRPTYYYLASGALDMQRRQDYGKEISEKVKMLDGAKFSFQYENLSIAGHNDSAAIGLSSALSFIYRDYNSYPEMGRAKSVLSVIKEHEKNVSDIYGVLPEKNSFDVYQPILSHIWQSNDASGMIDAIGYFITPESGGQQLRDFAYSCSIVGLNEKAKQLYERAIKKILADEMSTDLGPPFLITSYRELALNVLKNAPQESWDLLQKALKVSTQHSDAYPDMYFCLGRFSADNNFRVREGLNYLLLYEEKRKGLIDLNHVDFDEIYCSIGKCYARLGDATNARAYFQRAIDRNGKNKEAAELLQKLITSAATTTP